MSVVQFSRRDLLKFLCLSIPAFVFRARAAESQTIAFSHDKPDWKPISKGLSFARLRVLKAKEAVEMVGVLKIDPASNKIRVFNSFEKEKTIVRTIDEWQAETSAVALINSAQYMADPYYMPCALVICDGKQKGPKNNKSVRGMLVSEPQDSKLPKADLLDFEYDSFDPQSTSYTQGVQHWPILLDRSGKIKVKMTGLRSYRTVVALDQNRHILFFTTEGNYFSLHDFALFLKESNSRPDKGFQIRTAMNMDGGDEANMIIKGEKVSYFSYDERVKKNSDGNGPLLNWKTRLPGVVGVFPR